MQLDVLIIKKNKGRQKLLDMIDKLVTSNICSFEKAYEIGEITPKEYETIKKQRKENYLHIM